MSGISMNNMLGYLSGTGISRGYQIKTSLVEVDYAKLSAKALYLIGKS